MASERFVRGHDNGKEIGASAVAVNVNLPHDWAVAEHRFELRDGDELALRQLQDVVAAVDVHQLIGADLGHDVAGPVVAVGVEHLGGDLRSLVVAGEKFGRFDKQLASRVRLVGAEVPQIADIGQFVVDHRWTAHNAVHEHHTGLGRAVALQQVQVKEGLDPRLHFGRDGCRAGHRRDETPAEQALGQIGHHLGLRSR